MCVEFGRGEALVELEVDAAGRRVEAELAPGTVVVLPATMGVGEEVIGQLLDDIFERELPHLDLGVVPGERRVFDLGQRELDRGLSRPGADAFDLAAVSSTIEGDSDMGDAGGREAVEEAILVAGAQPWALCPRIDLSDHLNLVAVDFIGGDGAEGSIPCLEDDDRDHERGGEGGGESVSIFAGHLFGSCLGGGDHPPRDRAPQARRLADITGCVRLARIHPAARARP